jgi:hypothetical protein
MERLAPRRDVAIRRRMRRSRPAGLGDAKLGAAKKLELLAELT